MYVHNARQVVNGGATASLVPVRMGDQLMMRWDKAGATYTAAVVRLGERTSRVRFSAAHAYRLQQPGQLGSIGEARLVSIINIQPQHMNMTDITACGFAHYGELTDAFTYRRSCWLLRWDNIKEIT